MNTDRDDLDFEHHARKTDPLTSHISARGSSHKPARYAAILDALKRNGLGTCYELAAATGMTHVQVARCMKRLESRGLVARTDETRIGETGYPCTVWRKA